MLTTSILYIYIYETFYLINMFDILQDRSCVIILTIMRHKQFVSLEKKE